MRFADALRPYQKSLTELECNLVSENEFRQKALPVLFAFIALNLVLKDTSLPGQVISDNQTDSTSSLPERMRRITDRFTAVRAKGAGTLGWFE